MKRRTAERNQPAPKVGATSLAFSLLLAAPYASEAQTEDRCANLAAVRIAVQMYLDEKFLPDHQDMRALHFSYASAQLGPGPDPQIVVYLSGGTWCWHACPVLILRLENCGYKVFAMIQSDKSLEILPSSSDGWKDVAGWASYHSDPPW